MSKARNLFIEVSAALLIVLFVYTAINKLSDLNRFQWTLYKSPLLQQYRYFVSCAVPVAELITAILLLIPATRSKGFLCSLILMSLFTIYVAYMLAFIPNLPCSCGGLISSMNWTNHLIFNLFFTGLAYAAWIITKKDRIIAIIRSSRKPV